MSEKRFPIRYTALKQCSCYRRLLLPVDAFRKDRRSKSGTKGQCFVCDRKKRSDKKIRLSQAEYCRIKCLSTRKRHAKKLGVSPSCLEHEFGWYIDAMMTGLMDFLQNGCTRGEIVHRPSDVMGIQQATVDIINPGIGASWTMNCRWVCRLCNNKKNSKNSDDYQREVSLAKHIQGIIDEFDANPRISGSESPQMELFTFTPRMALRLVK